MEFNAALDEIIKVNLADGAKVSATDCRGKGFKAGNILDGDFDSYWATSDGVNKATVTFDLAGEKTFNRVLIQEYIPLGQRVKAFTVEAMGEDGQWKEIARETTIGYKRIVPVSKTTAQKVRINLEAYASPVINGFGLYDDNISEYSE